eukprot:17121-Chlamydomonas_euryale.AAC.2
MADVLLAAGADVKVGAHRAAEAGAARRRCAGGRAPSCCCAWHAATLLALNVWVLVDQALLVGDALHLDGLQLVGRDALRQPHDRAALREAALLVEEARLADRDLVERARRHARPPLDLDALKRAAAGALERRAALVPAGA